MYIAKKDKKEKAIDIMKKLDIYKPYIQGFEKDDTVCFFENFGGFWAYQEPELIEKIKEFENEFDALVFAVTHEYLEFGECYDFLYIPDCKEDWDDIVFGNLGGNKYYAWVYVWNKDHNECSESGTIGIQSFGGGIKRIL